MVDKEYIERESTCKDCIHYDICLFHVDEESRKEKCVHFKNKDDVAEVRHGEWEQDPCCKRIYYCSECGRYVEDDGINNPNEFFPYCHCGAKMDGGKE